MGRNAEDDTGQTVIHGSCIFFQRTRVPPLAFAFTKGSSGSCMSLEFRANEYDPERGLIVKSMSLLKI